MDTTLHYTIHIHTLQHKEYYDIMLTFLLLVSSSSMRKEHRTVSKVGTIMSEYLIVASTNKSTDRSIHPIHWICMGTTLPYICMERV